MFIGHFCNTVTTGQTLHTELQSQKHTNRLQVLTDCGQTFLGIHGSGCGLRGVLTYSMVGVVGIYFELASMCHLTQTNIH